MALEATSLIRFADTPESVPTPFMIVMGREPSGGDGSFSSQFSVCTRVGVSTGYYAT
jgi:hypothetical protein